MPVNNPGVVAHKTSHQDGGDDEVVVTSLSGLAADDQHVLDAEVTAVAIASTQKGAASGVASLDASSMVIQKPADRLSKANLEITLNKLLKGAGVGADPTEVDPGASAGDVAIAVSDHAALTTGVHGVGTGTVAKTSDICAVTLIADDVLRNSSDTEKFTEELAYTKIKQTKLNAALAGVRIKFTLKCGTTGATAKIYKNGSPTGIERVTTSTTGEVFSQDFTSLTTNDLIQIYAYTEAEDVAYVSLLRFYYSEYLTSVGTKTLSTALLTTTNPTISVTNEDP